MNDTTVSITFLIDAPKITAYLLNPQHARGGSKAKYLLRFGFKPDEPQILADALAIHAVNNLPGTIQSQPVGPSRIRFEGVVRAPDGRDMPLATVWEANEVNGERTLRFITAFPPTR